MKLLSSIALVLLIFLSGCGSFSTNRIEPTTGPTPLSKPEHITVMPFDSTDCLWILEVSSANEAIIQGNFPAQLTEAFAERLNQLIPSSLADNEQRSNTWLIEGRLRKVQLPDPALTASKRKPFLLCTVFVFDLNRSRIQPFLTYDIEVKDVKQDPLMPPPDNNEVKSEFLTLEKTEAARLLTLALQEYMQSRGWIEKTTTN